MKNKFVVFEGIDGAGKTFILEKLIEELLITGEITENDYVVTREPGGNNVEISEDIRNLIFKYKDISIMSESLLFLVSRSEHLDKLVYPNLNKNKIVFCDRFVYSSYVYQGLKLGNVEDIKKMNEIVLKGFMPSVTIIFDLDAEVAISRIALKNPESKNRFDDLDKLFFNVARKKYIKLANSNEGTYLINSDDNPKSIISKIIVILKENKII